MYLAQNFQITVPLVCVRKSGEDIRGQEPSPARNTLSAVRVRFCSGSCGLRQSQCCSQTLQALADPTKPREEKAYGMNSSIFKKQLPICLVKPHPYLHHSSRSQMLPFSTSKLSALDSFPDAQSLRFSSPHPAATKLTEGNTFVYAPSYPFSLSWFPAEILSRYQLSLSNS